jgi:hypothetical protein
MSRHLRRFLLIAGAAGALAIPSGAALAKIESVNTSCTNNGGGTPGGQQPTCKGGGLDQQKENQNPAGHAPAGQNK